MYIYHRIITYKYIYSYIHIHFNINYKYIHIYIRTYICACVCIAKLHHIGNQNLYQYDLIIINIWTLVTERLLSLGSFSIISFPYVLYSIIISTYFCWSFRESVEDDLSFWRRSQTKSWSRPQAKFVERLPHHPRFMIRVWLKPEFCSSTSTKVAKKVCTEIIGCFRSFPKIIIPTIKINC